MTELTPSAISSETTVPPPRRAPRSTQRTPTGTPLGRWWRRRPVRRVLDVVCRFESLDDDFARVCERLGLVPAMLPLLNPGDENDYLERYDDRYRAEIELFGYTFER